MAAGVENSEDDAALNGLLKSPDAPVDAGGAADAAGVAELVSKLPPPLA